MEQMNIMNMFFKSEEVNEKETKSEEVTAVETKETKTEETKTENVVKTKSTKVDTTTKKAKTKESSPANKYAKQESEIRNFMKVSVKVFGSEVKIFEGEEVSKIDLTSLQKELVELGYGEFSSEVVWAIIPDSSKTTAILVAGCKFFNKG